MKTSQWIKHKESPAVQTIGQLRLAAARQSNTSFPDWLVLARETFRAMQFPVPPDEQMYAHYLNGRSPLSAASIEIEDSKVT